MFLTEEYDEMDDVTLLDEEDDEEDRDHEE